MTKPELITLLRNKFGKVRKMGKEYLYIPCPTCKAVDRKKSKRFIYPPTYESSSCWICNTTIATQVLLDSSGFEGVEPALTPTPEKKVNPLASTLPCKRTVSLTELAVDHPAVKFLHKDFLYDLGRYHSEFGIVFCPSDGGMTLNSDPFVSSAERLIFPVTFNGNLVGWQMRSIPGTVYGDRDGVIRYYHLFNKGSYLYNFDNASKYDSVIVVEGVKKALKFQNAVATLGKGISQSQVELLVLHWNHVILMLDGELKAQEKANDIAEAIQLQGKKVLNINPSKYGYDSPDEMTEEVARNIVAENAKIWLP